MLKQKPKGNAMLVDQFSALTVKEQAETLKAFKAIHAESKAGLKAFLANAKLFRKNDLALKREAKAKAKAEKQAAAIEKAQARLQKLLEKQAQPVGIKAAKANRKPSKAVVTYGAEDNAIAAAIMAKKAGA